MRLPFFKDNGHYHSDFLSLIFSSANWDTFPTIDEYLHAHKIDYDHALLERIRESETRSVYDQLYYVAFLIYVRMQKTGDWGDVGEASVRTSFMRHVLDLDAHVQVTYEHYVEFDQLVAHHSRDLELLDLSIDQLNLEFDNIEISFLGRRFDIHHFVQLNRSMRFLGLDWFLQGGIYGYEKEFILGHGTFQQMGDYRVVHFDKEILRSPNTVMAMAAVIGEHEIFVRRDALLAIFYMKWVSSFEAREWGLMDDPYRQVSELIKCTCLDLYGVKSMSDLERIKHAFVDDLGETVLFHELGHGIIQYHLLPLNAATSGEATKMFGETIVSALLEFLADFAPQHDGTFGPIWNMCQIAKTDHARAYRMMMMYLSDTWFFDTTDTHMFLYSDLLSTTLASSISDDGLFSHWILESYLTGQDGRPHLVEWACSWVVSITDKLRAFAKQVTYVEDGKEVSFNELTVILKVEIEKANHDDAPVDFDDYPAQAMFWTEVFERLNDDSGYQKQIQKILDDFTSDVMASFVSTLTGKKGKISMKNIDLEAHRLERCQFLQRALS